MTESEYTIQKIKNGTVIDHLPYLTHLWLVGKILKFHKLDEPVLIASKLKGENGYKGVIKVENKALTQDEYNKIAIIAPDATVNIIENYRVVDKKKVELPDVLEGIVKCANEGCITNNERWAKSKLNVLDRKPLELKCHYCEHTFGRDNVYIL